MKTNFGAILVFCAMSLTVFAFADIDDYEIDYSDPESVVLAAKDMLMDMDFEAMLEVTESSQLAKTEDTLSSIEEDSSYKSELKGDVDLIIDIDIVRSDIFTNDSTQYAIVNTRWYVEKDPDEGKFGEVVEESSDANTFDIKYVDYLLQIFDEDWKIISQRNN